MKTNDDTWEKWESDLLDAERAYAKITIQIYGDGGLIKVNTDDVDYAPFLSRAKELTRRFGVKNK